MNPKADATLNIGVEMSENDDLESRIQQVVVKYNGDLERVANEVNGVVQLITERYAAIWLPISNVTTLLDYPEIEYMETPKDFTYNLNQSLQETCTKSVQDFAPYNLKGNGVLIGIIDSGINYIHPDFRNEDGSTRIVSLWDQSIEGNPPTGFREGTEYTSIQINEALRSTTTERLKIVPSQDTIGHGTHVASIAGGNGRASNGENTGMAPEAEFLIVKLKTATNQPLVRTVDIMLGIKYVIEKARILQKPIVVNISLGMNEGSHDGKSLIELFIEDIAQVWKTTIVIGSGNEGDARGHVEKFIGIDEQQIVEVNIGPNKKEYNLSVWQSAVDYLEFEIISPNGERTPVITRNQPPQKYVLNQTIVYTAFAGPSPLNGAVEFAIYFFGISQRLINEGNWQINVYARDILDGVYNIWGQTKEQASRETFFLQATPEKSLTTPSTASNAITVGAYNSRTNQLADFSGRGFTRYPVQIKPDLVAPGVDILAASQTGGYRRLSGTSMAAPHVTGAAALLMEWGIVKGNQQFLYGETLKSYLIRGAIRDNNEIIYPDISWGYGKLCVKRSIDLLRRERIIG